MPVHVEAEALERSGALYLRRGLPVAAIATWSRWLAEARRQGDPALVVRATNALAAAHAAARDAAGAESLLRRALETVETTAVPSEERVKTHLNLALNLLQLGELEGALASALEAREICAVGASLPLVARVSVTLSGLHVVRGEWAEADRATSAALAFTSALGERTLLARALNNRAMILLHAGRTEEARAALERAIDLAEGSARPAELAFHFTEMAHVHLQSGEVDLALAWATRALDAMWSDIGSLEEAEAARLSRLFGLVAQATGDRDKAVVWFNRAASYYAQAGRMEAWRDVSEHLAEVLKGPRAGAAQPRVRIPARTRDRLQYLTSLLSLSDSIASVEPRLGLHSALVTQYALRLGERLGFQPGELDVVGHAGRFHDIGKIVIAMPTLPRREDVAGRPQDERVLVHPKTGRDMLAMFPLPAEVIRAVACHHERWDGGGYPEGLVGEAIPPAARVLMTANLYVALTWDPHPTPPLAHEEALAVLARESGRALDPACVAAFLDLHAVADDSS
ncbi:MAG: tetratricopeptide repeat protein [Clostridia bacterium]|nr:tetratricopeptide repeat protein [Clostridia bacterium]